MAHGDEDVIFDGDNNKIFINEIRGVYTGIKSLDGKPKLFVIQSCRGSRN